MEDPSWGLVILFPWPLLAGVCPWLGRPHRLIYGDWLLVTLTWLFKARCLPCVHVWEFLLIMVSFIAVMTSLPQILTVSPSMTLFSAYQTSSWWNRAVFWVPLFTLHIMRVMHILPVTSPLWRVRSWVSLSTHYSSTWLLVKWYRYCPLLPEYLKHSTFSLLRKQRSTSKIILISLFTHYGMPLLTFSNTSF